MKNSESELIQKYTKLVTACVSKYAINNNFEDLCQEAFIELLLAIRSYDDTHSCSLSTYAYVCINNRLKNIVSRPKDMYKLKRENIVYNIDDILPDSLTDIEREIVFFRLCNYTFREIAEYYNFKLNTIKTKYRRTIAKIRKANKYV